MACDNNLPVPNTRRILFFSWRFRLYYSLTGSIKDIDLYNVFSPNVFPEKIC